VDAVRSESAERFKSVGMQFVGSFANVMSGFYKMGNFIGKIPRIQLFCEPCLFFAVEHVEARLATPRRLGEYWARPAMERVMQRLLKASNGRIIRQFIVVGVKRGQSAASIKHKRLRT